MRPEHSIEGRGRSLTTCAVLLVCLLTAASCRKAVSALSRPAPASSPPTSRPIYAPLGATPLAWVHHDSYDLPLSNAGHQRESLEVAVYPDRTVVWSTAPAHQGPPYVKSRITAAALETLRAALSADAAACAPDDTESNVGPDAAFTVLTYDLGPGPVSLSSWHEDSADGGLIATDRGIEPLNGRNRDAVLAASAPAYRKFRLRWSDLRRALAEVIPPSGDPVNAVDIAWR
jgi:hypothetical protein